jgi:LysR family glycine cleavage system transcriptional activator
MSFKTAAEELGVTPTAISHQVRELEQHCGRALFRRRPRPLALTLGGAQLFPVLQEGLDKFAATIAGISGGTGRQKPLKVTATNAFAHRWLVPRLARWREACPGVPLEIIGTDSVIDLRAGEADLAIRYQRNPPPGLVSHELFRDTFWPIASPAVLRATPLTRPADLSRHTLIHMAWQPWEPSPPTWGHWFKTVRCLHAETPEAGADALSFREELHAIEAVIAGQGIAILSDVLVGPELASGTLVKAFDLPLPGFGFYLTFVRDHARCELIDSFQAWLRSAV